MRALGDAQLATRIFGSQQATLTLLRALWPGAVGEQIASRTELIAVERGVLRMWVADAHWMRVLYRMQREIVRRLRAAAGAAAPEKLAFLQAAAGWAPARERAAQPARPIPPAPPSAALLAAAAAIADPDLREAFLTSAARYLGRTSATEPAPLAS
jgi:hypothetical protein